MVFLDLARKAGSIGAKSSLAGWLYRGVQLQALEWRRNRQRRQQREPTESEQDCAPQAEHPREPCRFTPTRHRRELAAQAGGAVEIAQLGLIPHAASVSARTS